MKDQEFKDLANLANVRCRDAFLGVAQLVDDKSAVVAMLMSVALEFIQVAGSAMAEEKDMPKAKGVAAATLMVVDALGKDNINNMLKEMT